MSRWLNTVTGPIETRDMGRALVHEHVIVDWVGADESGPHRYDRLEVVRVMLPYLGALVARGYRTFFDCAPVGLGRDPELLRLLSEASGLAIVTNTGYYKEPYVPSAALKLAASEMADIWVREHRHGIGETSIRPGFIKIAVPAGALPPLQRTVVTAAGLASLVTGLPIASHTSDDIGAIEQLELLADMGLPLTQFILVHADGLSRPVLQMAARAGAWLEFDCVGGQPIGFHVELLSWASTQGLLPQTLISHDAGWYNVGQPGGGSVRPFTAIEDALLPALRQTEWFEPGFECLLLVDNPAKAFAIEQGECTTRGVSE